MLTLSISPDSIAHFMPPDADLREDLKEGAKYTEPAKRAYDPRRLEAAFRHAVNETCLNHRHPVGSRVFVDFVSGRQSTPYIMAGKPIYSVIHEVRA